MPKPVDCWTAAAARRIARMTGIQEEMAMQWMHDDEGAYLLCAWAGILSGADTDEASRKKLRDAVRSYDERCNRERDADIESRAAAAGGIGASLIADLRHGGHPMRIDSDGVLWRAADALALAAAARRLPKVQHWIEPQSIRDLPALVDCWMRHYAVQYGPIDQYFDIGSHTERSPRVL